MSTNNPTSYRSLINVIEGKASTDGDGVKIRRSLTPGRASRFDPFLLLDEIYSDQPEDYIGGFPEHPHRGFETVTYMLDGAMKHRDHMGNEGKLVPGSVQWMTAGKGIIHSEIPEQTEGLLHGFQLWINLPAEQKLSAPNYQEYHPEQIPAVLTEQGHQLKVIAGSFTANQEVIQGPVTGVSTQPEYFDIQLANNQPLVIPLAVEKTAAIYVYQGELQVNAHTSDTPLVSAGQLGLLSNGNQLEISATQPDTRALLFAARPLQEPIAHWGPFVMNTHEQVEQAINDYQRGTLI